MRPSGAVGSSPQRYHLWPHAGRVLDLGDDAHVAAQLHDFAAHDYGLRGVRLRGAGAVHVMAYYDGQHQSGLTQGQLDLVRAWVRRHAAPAHEVAVAPDTGTPPAPPHASDRSRWLVPALAPAVLALLFVAYAVTWGGVSIRQTGPLLVSASAALALCSAVVTWRRTREWGATARDPASAPGLGYGDAPVHRVRPPLAARVDLAPRPPNSAP